MQRLTRLQLVATAVIAMASAVVLADPGLAAVVEPVSIELLAAAF